MEHKCSDPGGANTVNVTQCDIVVALFAREFRNCSHVAEDLDKARAKMEAFSAIKNLGTVCTSGQLIHQWHQKVANILHVLWASEGPCGMNPLLEWGKAITGSRASCHVVPRISYHR